VGRAAELGSQPLHKEELKAQTQIQPEFSSMDQCPQIPASILELAEKVRREKQPTDLVLLCEVSPPRSLENKRERIMYARYGDGEWYVEVARWEE
jgi:hypothetical protein